VTRRIREAHGMSLSDETGLYCFAKKASRNEHPAPHAAQISAAFLGRTGQRLGFDPLR
jgi:hypothetical protein